MKINKLKINSYGKLKEKEINLENGINLIYGENEAGKSTLIKFIINSFYGISKNKKGKEFSDYEKYKPWTGEEFSGKINYELDNKEKYELFRDFNKKNPKIFNENMEEITKEFNIDKNKGNEFFYEQTKIDEDLFLSTLAINQKEVKLEKQTQNILIQKIANLVGTGDDNISYKRAIDRINRRQLDEIGSERSREKPINIISRKIEELENEKEDYIKQRENSEQEYKLSMIEKRNQIEENIKSEENNLEALENNNSKYTIKSPVNGVILNANYNTVGSYINQSKSIAEIVSSDSELKIETYITNKDIARIEKGQKVVIKLEAYDYQKYGTLDGTIDYISPSAIVDKELGAVYKVKIKFDKNQNSNIDVLPGMTVTLETKSGKQRIIEYFLEPFKKNIDNALKG